MCVVICAEMNVVDPGTDKNAQWIHNRLEGANYHISMVHYMTGKAAIYTNHRIVW